MREGTTDRWFGLTSRQFRKTITADSDAAQHRPDGLGRPGRSRSAKYRSSQGHQRSLPIPDRSTCVS
jgi:hypothetical protein